VFIQKILVFRGSKLSVEVDNLPTSHEERLLYSPYYRALFGVNATPNASEHITIHTIYDYHQHQP
jgi:hypothetical protein